MLTHRPFSSLRGKLVDEKSVDTATALLREHAAADAAKAQTAADKEAVLAEANRARMADVSFLNGPTVPESLIYTIADNLPFKMEGFKLAESKLVGGKIEVVVESVKTGESRKFTITVK